MSRGRASKAANIGSRPEKKAHAAPMGAAPLSATQLLQPITRPALGLFAAYILFAFILPALADMTPPGVDPKLVAVVAEQQAIGVRAGCEEACKGMGCPAGWMTARSPDDPCKCICARVDPSNANTAWDEQQRASQQKAAQQQPQQEQPQSSEQSQPAMASQPPDQEVAGDATPTGGEMAGGAAGAGADASETTAATSTDEHQNR